MVSGGLGGSASGLGGETGGGAGAPSALCTANEAICDGNRATTCNAMGTGYLVGGTKCSTDQTCSQGSCENHKCMPSSVFCQDQALKTCATNGLTSTSQTCDVNATCTGNAGSAACVCKLGYSGTGLSCTATICGANQHVQANVCVPCAAGTNAAGNDASGADTSCIPPSCLGLAANCSGESCCTSPTVTGGMFNRDNDMNSPAMVSSFRLDKYEVTVGRFRKFVDAVVGGWKPVAGSGKHTHLNGGAGLRNRDGAGNEPGWDAKWTTTTNLPANKDTWDGSSYLFGCSPTQRTWTPISGENETKPINCVTWYQAAAFCIWDGGFLPSEAEWNYAAAGGNLQRQYPWSTLGAPTTPDCSYANYLGASDGAGFCVTPGTGTTSVVGSVSPKGNGWYGQADLAGNVWEWNLDWSGAYATTCNNCANSAEATNGVARGGSFNFGESSLLSSQRGAYLATGRFTHVGLRCARTP